MASQDKMSVDKIFDLLDKWRLYPAYQLERRVDIFIAAILPKLIEHKYQKEVFGILPEFPLRVSDVKPEIKSNQSYRIDYVALCNDSTVYLIEFKTEMDSLNENQDAYLNLAKTMKVSSLVEGLLKIYDKTKQKAKYRYYIEELKRWGWVKVEGDDISNTGSNHGVEILYIQPIKRKKEQSEIVFDDIIRFLDDYDDPISSRLKVSLRKWEAESKRKTVKRS